MESPYQIAYFHNSERIQREQAETLQEMVRVLSYQAESARESQKAAWRVTVWSLAVACGSLACAVIALFLGR